ncbi:hypothetical protein GUJ93_ZPchr0014g47591 [Zizania palustris]|uniref:Uncharacterized protein n=1 Tax=Zizania palustris TaxID=103762 RepID=A0A8J5TB82_ZIZPA|nr:hypothetical protein GUJ93_ZPchr0014g47591 [Zizania palustris]
MAGRGWYVSLDVDETRAGSSMTCGLPLHHPPQQPPGHLSGSPTTATSGQDATATTRSNKSGRARHHHTADLPPSKRPGHTFPRATCARLEA